MPRVRTLNAYWRQHPPVHLLLAAHIGYTAPEAADPEQQDALPTQTLSESEFEQLLKEKGIIP